MEKKYKFKYKPSGEWHDIIRHEGRHGMPSYYCAFNNVSLMVDAEKFLLTAKELPRLLHLLEDMNIEVAEDTDEIKWQRVKLPDNSILPSDSGYIYESQKVFDGKKAVIYKAATDAIKLQCEKELKENRKWYARRNTNSCTSW